MVSLAELDPQPIQHARMVIRITKMTIAKKHNMSVQVAWKNNSQILNLTCLAT
jgi:hypothetical protein